jgi:large subunit ribosomal protein L21
MYAVILTGGKQYRVSQGEELRLEKLPGNPGDTIVFPKVLMGSDGERVSVGRPYVEGSQVVARIVHQGRGRKAMVFKYRRRKGYRTKRGHRQPYTLVRVEQIQV